MVTNKRLEPLLEQYDWAIERLLTRIDGPTSNSGDGRDVEVPALTDAEYLWEPVDACWSVRKRTDGPGTGAVKLIGAGEWGRDGAPESPWPPPFTTIAWRLDHVSETLLGRASHLGGDRSFDRAKYEPRGVPLAPSRDSARQQPTGARRCSASTSPTMTAPD